MERSSSSCGHPPREAGTLASLRTAWILFLVVGLPLGLMAALVALASAGIVVAALSPLWTPWPPDAAKEAVGALGFAAALGYLVVRTRAPSAASRGRPRTDGSRILAITVKSLSQLGNDRRTAAFVIVVPLMLILIFGYGFGGQPSHVPTAVYNADRGPAGNVFLANLPAGILDLTNVSSAAAAEGSVANATSWAALVIPADFSSGLLTGNASLTVYLDGSNPTVAAAVMGAVQSSIQKILNRGNVRAPLTVTPSYVYGSADTSFIDTLAPGVMALVAVFATTVLSILVLVREKSAGLLERLFATPLRPRELVLGHSLSLLVVAAAQSLVVFAAAVLIFQASFVGDVALAFGVLLLFALGNIGLGLLISSVAQSEFQAVQLIPFLIFPQLFFAGALFPLVSIPVAVRPISVVLPLTYASDALRSILLRGWGSADIAWDLVALLLYAAVTLGGAAVLVRRQA